VSKPTRQALLTTALEARGYVRDTRTRVTRYLVFRPPSLPLPTSLLRDKSTDHRVYLGAAGACRYSTTGAVAFSIPFSINTVERLLTEGRFGGLAAYKAALARENAP
jgi:hypothetical protein